MQHGAALVRESGDPALAEAVASGRSETLGPRLRALVEYAVKLTRFPEAMVEADVERLRDAGLDDRAIVDANQVVAYFNYVNRVADGLGVELEREWPDEVKAPRAYWATVPAGSLPWLDVEQMRALDRIAVEDFGLTLERMTENAGRSLAGLARQVLGGRLAGREIAVLAGPGGNGGGGLVAARHLANAGAEVTVVLSHADAPHEPPAGADLVLDALLGYSQVGPPRGEVGRLAAWTRGRRVVSLDLPTGLAGEPHVEAEATLTLAAPKRVLLDAGVEAGALFLADLSIPAAAYERAGIRWRSPFETSPVVRLVG